MHIKCEKSLRAYNAGNGLATLADGKAHADSTGGADSTKRSTLLTDIQAPGTRGDRLSAAGLDFCTCSVLYPWIGTSSVLGKYELQALNSETLTSSSNQSRACENKADIKKGD